MLSSELIDCIKCAVPHKCASEDDGSKFCAQCRIGYSFIAREPRVLDCGHHVCKECKEKFQDAYCFFTCNVCFGLTKVSDAKGAAAEFLIKTNLNDLAKMLLDKYSNANLLQQGFEEKYSNFF